MTTENVREPNEKGRFTFVVVSGGETGKIRTFSASRWVLISSCSVAFFGIVALIFFMLSATPARKLLPVSDSGLEERYGKEITVMQEQIVGLLQEMDVLTSYNLKLRKALEQQIPFRDTGLIVSSSETTQGMFRGSPRADTMSESQSPSMNQNASGQGHGKSILTWQGRPAGRQIYREFPFTMPVGGYVSRSFDAGKYHHGIDFVNRLSTPILAAADGNVIFAGWTYNDGMMMMIAHELGYVTVYKHSEALMKDTGSPVKRGEVIALLGNTGNTSSGPHLHFEVWKDGIPKDPANYLLENQ